MNPRKSLALSAAIILTAVTLGLDAKPVEAGGLVIDDFTTDQAELNVSPTDPHQAGSPAAGGGSTGGERDLLLSTEWGGEIPYPPV